MEAPERFEAGGATSVGRAPEPAEGRTRLRPIEVSAAGRGVLGGVVIAYVAGVLLGYPLLLVLAGAGIVLLVAAVGFVLRRPRVRVRRDFQPSSVTAGQAAVAVLGVTNISKWPSPPLNVADRLGDTDIEMPIRSLAPGRSALVRYPLPTSRRGRVGLGPLRVVRSDPFDLLRRRQPAGGVDVLWVHPRTWTLAPLPAGVIVDFEGPVSETGSEGSLTFSSLREYIPGDDRRQIHWRSSARLGTLLVRRNVDANEPRATVVLDTRTGPWSAESFEEGVEIAASAVRALTGTGHPVDLRILGERPDDPRLEGASSSADRLAAVALDPAATSRGLFAVLELGAGGGSLVLVTGRIDQSLESHVSRQNRRFAPVVLCCVDPAHAPHWRRRSGMNVVTGGTAPEVAQAWNQLFGR